MSNLLIWTEVMNQISMCDIRNWIYCAMLLQSRHNKKSSNEIATTDIDTSHEDSSTKRSDMIVLTSCIGQYTNCI